MRIARFTPAACGPAAYGLVEGEGDELVVVPMEGSPYDGLRRAGKPLPLRDVVLLAPVEPSKVLAFGRNYAEHTHRGPDPLDREPGARGTQNRPRACCRGSQCERARRGRRAGRAAQRGVAERG